jgi:hypothetical protein
MAAPTLRLIQSTALADLLVGRHSAYLDGRVPSADMAVRSLRRRDTDAAWFLTATSSATHDLVWQLVHCQLICTEGLLAQSRRLRNRERWLTDMIVALEVAQWAHYASGSPT